MSNLFPPHLNVGSHGAAVDSLHQVLCMLNYGEGIVRDGEYGEKTVDAVKRLQANIGLPANEIDGNFGPMTRAQLMAHMGIDVSIIPGSHAFDDSTAWFGPDTPEGNPEFWQPLPG